MTVAKQTRAVLLAAALAATLLLASTASASAAEPAWRLGSLSDTAAAPNSTFTYHLNLTDVGDANSSAGAVLSGRLPAGFTAQGISFSTPEGEHPLEEPIFGGNVFGTCAGNGPGGHLAGAGEFTCTIEEPIEAHNDWDANFGVRLGLHLSVAVGSPAELEPHPLASFRLEGGGAAAPSSTVDPTLISSEPPPFGIEAFDNQVGADAAGDPFSQAAGHPNQVTTSIDFNRAFNPAPLKGDLWPLEPVRDIVAQLPPGFLGDPAGLDQCTISQLAHSRGTIAQALCPPTSQVGTVMVRVNGFPFWDEWGPLPLFNMVPPPRAPARFGLNVKGTVVVLDAHLRSSGDYGLSAEGRDASEGLDFVGVSTTFWGVPADEAHRGERACPGETAPWSGEGSPSCPNPNPPRAFLRNPTACTARANEGLTTSLKIDSWFHLGAFDSNGEPAAGDPNWVEAQSKSHQLPGYPYPPEEQGEAVGIEGCEEVPFEPTISVQPTIDKADSPSGLKVDLSVPQDCWGAKATVAAAEEAICQSDLKKAAVKLPAGLSVNPSVASGLEGCSPSQIGLTTPEGSTPIHFNTADPTCPDGSKLGTVEVDTPLLGKYDSEGKPVLDAEGNSVPEPLTGSVYLAKQGDNPFGSLLAIYLVLKGQGVIVKLPGKIVATESGQLETVFDNNPQLPFETLHLELFSGPRAALRTPPACGTYTTTAELTPWSHQGTEGEAGTPIAGKQSSFQITEGPNGGPCPSQPAAFAPKLNAGTANPLAGAFSPFNLRISREDASQQLAGLSVSPPPGLLASLRGIPYCPDAALSAISAAEGTGAAEDTGPHCPPASQVGTVTVGAGAGTEPFYTDKGRAYLAGPYKGAPLSLAVVTPAIAGPFDLGTVVVRNALRVDPETTRIEAVSDPLPTILFGIPLDLRDVRVQLNRPGFTLNPTSCNEMSVGGTASGTEGATAPLADRFQVLGCDRLAFKPKLSFKLKGKTNRGAHPALRAVLTMPPSNEAGIARAQVTLPHAEFLDQGHIRNVCTRVQYTAGNGGGEQCPAGSVYGHATAWSPLLDQPLSGNVYLRSSSHELPDLVLALHTGETSMTLMGPTSRKGSVLNISNVTAPKGVSKKRLLKSLAFEFTQTDRSSRAAASKKKHPSMGFSGSMARGGNPALTAVLTTHQGPGSKHEEANIKRISATLPHSAFLDQAHIRTVCTRVQFNAGAGNGAECPAGSIYGHAKAITPLLDDPLVGNVYLRSSEHPLPDMVIALHGLINVDVVGRIDSKNGGIRSTFESVPDAPVTKFILEMSGGKRGLIENSTNLCTSTNNVHIEFDAQNGKTMDQSTPLVPGSCPKKHPAKKHHPKH